MKRLNLKIYDILFNSFQHSVGANNYSPKMLCIAGNIRANNYSPLQNRNKFYSILLSFLITLFVSYSFAKDDVRVEASVNYPQTQVGDYIQYNVRFYNVGNLSQNDIQLPNFESKGLKVNSSGSTQVQNIINFEVTSYTEYKITLAAQQVGKFDIEPTVLNYNGTQYSSQGVSIEVTPTSNGETEAKGSSAFTGDADIDRQLRGNLYIKEELPKKEFYIGEQIPLSYSLYSYFNLAGNISLVEAPECKNFIVEDYPIPQGIQKREKNIDGKQFAIYFFSQKSLFATVNGKQTISPYKLNVNIPVEGGRRRDIFDMAFSNYKAAVVSSEPIELNIKPLPEENKPTDFDGVVGEYTFNYSIDKTDVEEGEPISIKIEISGKGQVDALTKPKVPAIDGAEVYDIGKKIDKNWDAQGLINGKATFDIVIRPNKPGTIVIPEIKYPIFDPSRNQYVEFKTAPISLNVKAVAKTAPTELVQANQSAATSQNTGTVQVVSENIRYIKSASEGFNGESKSIDSIISLKFFILQLLPIGFMIGAYIISRRRIKLESDTGYRRNLFAKSMADKTLSNAKKSLNKPDDIFYAEINTALTNYIADKFNTSALGLTTYAIKEILQNEQFEESFIKEIIDIIERCDIARFTSAKTVNEDKKETYQKVAQIINQIEKKVKK